MNKTIRGDRLHIAFFGKRNAGKSSLINSLTNQEIAIVSDIAGTTTDPVYKAMEFQPIGPVVLVDTAGIDDIYDKLGEERVKRTNNILKKTDVALLIIDSQSKEFDYENELVEQFNKNKTKYIIVINKIDLDISQNVKQWLNEKSFIRVSAVHNKGIDILKKRIQDIAPTDWEPPFIKDLIHPGEIVVLVTPIDLGAPKGRLIMPQIKALRDILDADAIPVMCKERELLTTLNSLKDNPSLVVTDSQVFPQVAADVSEEINLTSFSILSIRQKGDLDSMVRSVLAVKDLKPGDRVLIAESCTHHPLEDDIARVKIPRWLNAYVGGELNIETVPGAAFPEKIADYKLVIHCGACTLNRREMLSRQSVPQVYNVPMTNFGVLISFLKGVFPRALKPFPEVYSLFAETQTNYDVNIMKKMALHAEV